MVFGSSRLLLWTLSALTVAGLAGVVKFGTNRAATSEVDLEAEDEPLVEEYPGDMGAAYDIEIGYTH